MTKKLYLANGESYQITSDNSVSGDRPSDVEIATRKNLGEFYSHVFQVLENPDPVLRKTGSSVAVYHEIRRETHVATCISSRRAGTQKRPWKITGKNTAAVETLTSLFDNMDMERIVREILDAIFYGYQILETPWRVIDNLLLPYDIIGKPQEWFWFNQDNELMRKHGNSIDGVLAEKMNFLCVQHEATYMNPYGEGALGNCFWPVTFKKGGIKYWALFLQKFGIPHAIGKLPRGADHVQRSQLLTALGNMIRDAAAVFPDDSSVELLEAAATGGSSDMFEKHARYHDGEMSKVLLGHSAAADSTPGKLGGENSTLQVREDLIESDVKMVQNAFNTLIKRIAIYNPNLFKNELPQLELSKPDDVDKTLAERDEILQRPGNVRFTKKYFVNAYKLQEDDIVVDETIPAAVSPIAGPSAQFSSPLPAGDKGGQAQIDTLLNGIPESVKQKQAKDLFGPIVDLINKSESYEEVQAGLAKLYPNLKTSDLQLLIEKAMTLSKVWGMLN